MYIEKGQFQDVKLGKKYYKIMQIKKNRCELKNKKCLKGRIDT